MKTLEEVNKCNLGEYFFPYTDEVGVGCWDWLNSSVDRQRLFSVGLFETTEEAMEESIRLNEIKESNAQTPLPTPTSKEK